MYTATAPPRLTARRITSHKIVWHSLHSALSEQMMLFAQQYLLVCRENWRNYPIEPVLQALELLMEQPSQVSVLPPWE